MKNQGQAIIDLKMSGVSFLGTKEERYPSLGGGRWYCLPTPFDPWTVAESQSALLLGQSRALLTGMVFVPRNEGTKASTLRPSRDSPGRTPGGGISEFQMLMCKNTVGISA